MTERRRSFGSVAYLGRDRDGKGRWRLRFPRDGRRATEVVHGTRRDAEHRLAELHVEAGAERGGSVTLAQARERWWLPDAEARLSPASLRHYDGAWRSRIAPRWGDVPVAAITPLGLQEWLEGMTGPVAATCMQVIRPILARCVVLGVIPANPAAAGLVMPRARAEHDKGVWDAEGLRLAWSAVRGSPIEAPFLLMAFGSCRVGESLGVRPGEVSLRRDMAVPLASVKIDRQVEYRTGLPTDRLKTESSRRAVAVPGRPGLRLAELAAAAEGRGDAWLADDGTGAPLSHEALRNEWRRLLVPPAEHHPARNLRTSWETLAHWELGLDPTIIEKLMGHTGRSVTARHYDRPGDDAMLRAVADAYAANSFADGWGL